ncbi:hypothetical protein C3495_02515 [Clostridiaceae bacterium 14S0207]|nr:hypothetical protein C3495_02515 [Clostridiaceae bacterium 14S0207]
MGKKKKKMGFPTAFTVLFIVLILAAILTYVVPAGTYSKLAFDADKKIFTITKPDGSVSESPATKETLDKLKIKIDIEKLTSGAISKPVAIPGTYEKVAQKPQGFFEVISAPIEGVYQSVDIILFILIIGGCIGVLNNSGAFDAGIASLSRATKGREFLLIVIVTILISIGGTTYGMAEETIALYPILVPVFVAAGYDAMVAIASIYVGSSIGTMFSTVNAFSSVVASNAAGLSFTEGIGMRFGGLIVGTVICIIYIVKYANKVKKDPTKSIIYDQKEEIEKRFATVDEKDVPEFTLARKLMLLMFAGSFGIMVWGVSSQDWSFSQMTSLFLIVGIILGILSRMGEKAFVNKFIEGAADLVSVGLIVGVARSINIVLEGGQISDTILNGASSLVSGMNPIVFVLVMLVVFIVLGFFIPSSSGLAVLSIPVMAPLADSVGLPRHVIVSAFQYGLGLISFITPTGLILATLSIVDVTYDKWLKFVMPLIGIIAALAAVILMVQGAIA